MMYIYIILYILHIYMYIYIYIGDDSNGDKMQRVLPLLNKQLLPLSSAATR